jgi:hypothetical protein
MNKGNVAIEREELQNKYAQEKHAIEQLQKTQQSQDTTKMRQQENPKPRAYGYENPKPRAYGYAQQNPKPRAFGYEEQYPKPRAYGYKETTKKSLSPELMAKKTKTKQCQQVKAIHFAIHS